MPILANLSNITGPFFDRKSLIYYKIINLIPKYTENDFEPFYLWFDEISEKRNVLMNLKLYCSQSSNPISKDFEITIVVDNADK